MRFTDTEAHAFMSTIQPVPAASAVRFPWRGGDDWRVRTCYGRFGYGWRAFLLWHARRVLRFFTGRPRLGCEVT